MYFWIRKQVRKVMKPVPVRVAEEYTLKLTNLYVFFSAMACFLTLYRFIEYRKKQRRENPSYNYTTNPGMYYGKVLKAENMIMYSVNNGTLVKEGVYRLAEDDSVKKENQDFFGE